MGDAITGEAKDVGEVIGGWAFSVATSDTTDIKTVAYIVGRRMHCDCFGRR